MSLEIRCDIICDGCGARIQSEVEHRSTQAVAVPWDAQFKAQEAGWLTVNRGRFHTPTHWCPKCCDKPMKPVPRKKRQKEFQ